MNYPISIDEHCYLCGSKNYLYIDKPITEAFECWNCMTVQWLDDDARLTHMVYHEVDFVEAEENLRNGEVIVINGQAYI